MFAFLSGIGLKQSLDKNPDLKRYYTRRVIRVLIPYLIIAGITYVERDLLYLHDIGRFFSDLSCISYWTAGRGAWYVAWTVPVYIIYPFYHWMRNKSKQKAWLPIVILVLLTAICFIVERIGSNMISRFSSPIGATIAFIIGDAVARKVVEDDKHILYYLLIGFVIAPLYILRVIYGDVIYTWFFALCGVALVSGFSLLVSLIEKTRFYRWLCTCGSASLEIYLFNLLWIGIADRFFEGYKTSLIGVAVYVGVFIATLISALLYKKVENRIVTK